MPIRLAAGDGDADQIGKKKRAERPAIQLDTAELVRNGGQYRRYRQRFKRRSQDRQNQADGEPAMVGTPDTLVSGSNRQAGCMTLLALTGDRIHVVVSHATPRSRSAAARELYRSRKQSSSPGGTVRHLAFRSGAIRAYNQNDANHSSFRVNSRIAFSCCQGHGVAGSAGKRRLRLNPAQILGRHVIDQPYAVGAAEEPDACPMQRAGLDNQNQRYTVSPPNTLCRSLVCG